MYVPSDGQNPVEEIAESGSEHNRDPVGKDFAKRDNAAELRGGACASGRGPALSTALDILKANSRG